MNIYSDFALLSSLRLVQTKWHRIAKNHSCGFTIDSLTDSFHEHSKQYKLNASKTLSVRSVQIVGWLRTIIRSSSMCRSSATTRPILHCRDKICLLIQINVSTLLGAFKMEVALNFCWFGTSLLVLIGWYPQFIAESYHGRRRLAIRWGWCTDGEQSKYSCQHHYS